MDELLAEMRERIISSAASDSQKGWQLDTLNKIKEALKPSNKPVTIDDIFTLMHMGIVKENKHNPLFRECGNLLRMLSEKGFDKIDLRKTTFWEFFKK